MSLSYRPFWAALPALFVATESVGFSTCDRPVNHYTASPSCYNTRGTVPERPNSGRFDVSIETFQLLTDQLNPTRIQCISEASPLHNTLPLIKRGVLELTENHTLFFYFDNYAGESGNSDCYIYAGLQVQGSPVEPLHRLTPHIDHPPCDEASYDISELFRCATAPPENALLLSPYDRYMMAAHPDQNVSQAYADSIVDEWLMFNKEFGYVEGDLEGELPIEINVPAWVYVSEEDAGLRQIATNLGLREEAWQFLWELNVEGIKNPHMIEENTSLVVPAKISEWVEIQDLDLSVDEVSEKFYGTTDYASLVEHAKRVAEVLGQEEDVHLPIFEAGREIKPTPVTSVIGSMR